MKPVLHSALSIFMGALFMVAFPAMAMTPDGSTPAQEAICDPLMEDGVSKGLYGLCVAFCEANDFADENVPVTEEELLAIEENLKAPSGRILANYNKKMDENDPSMPCLVPAEEECACWTPEDLLQIDNMSPIGGTRLSHRATITASRLDHQDLFIITPITLIKQRATLSIASKNCRYIDSTESMNRFLSVSAESITQESLDKCQQMLQDSILAHDG